MNREMMPRRGEELSPQEAEDKAKKQEELNTVYESAVRYKDQETIDTVKGEMRELGFDVPKTSHEGYSEREAQQIRALSEAVENAESHDQALAEELREKLRAAMEPVQEDRIDPITEIDAPLEQAEERRAA